MHRLDFVQRINGLKINFEAIDGVDCDFWIIHFSKYKKQHLQKKKEPKEGKNSEGVFTQKGARSGAGAVTTRTQAKAGK